MRELLSPVIRFAYRFKRALTLAGVVAFCLLAFMAVRGVMPFMPVFGTSMEPELHAGNLIIIEGKDPAEVEVGDIIVFNVPASIQDFYNYPPVVAHRVIEVRDTEFGIAWRTRGDNAGEDPFTIRANDLRGTVSTQIPFLGFPLLFLQSQQGLIFVSVSLALFAFYLYASDLSRGGQKIHRGLFAPVIEETEKSSEALAQRIGTTERVMSDTQQALSSFASAMAEYAEHLRSHTSAIQGLAEASHELKRGAAEQNRVLERIMLTLEKKEQTSEEAPAPPVRRVSHTRERAGYPPGCARSRRFTERDEIIGAG
jgi:signal peptidase I